MAENPYRGVPCVGNEESFAPFGREGSEGYEREAITAKKLCVGCKAVDFCLAEALVTADPDNIRGAKTPSERRVLRQSASAMSWAREIYGGGPAHTIEEISLATEAAIVQARRNDQLFQGREKRLRASRARKIA